MIKLSNGKEAINMTKESNDDVIALSSIGMASDANTDVHVVVTNDQAKLLNNELVRIGVGCFGYTVSDGVFEVELNHTMKLYVIVV